MLKITITGGRSEGKTTLARFIEEQLQTKGVLFESNYGVEDTIRINHTGVLIPTKKYSPIKKTKYVCSRCNYTIRRHFRSLCPNCHCKIDWGIIIKGD